MKKSSKHPWISGKEARMVVARIFFGAMKYGPQLSGYYLISQD